jgi:hypothetical protein
MMIALARQLMMARPTYLTPHTAKCSSESADGTDLASSAGAPAIEVTPAMIEAGAAVVAGVFDEVVAYGSETAKATAIWVFRAMSRAREHAAK